MTEALALATAANKLGDTSADAFRAHLESALAGDEDALLAVPERKSIALRQAHHAALARRIDVPKGTADRDVVAAAALADSGACAVAVAVAAGLPLPSCHRRRYKAVRCR